MSCLVLACLAQILAAAGGPVPIPKFEGLAGVNIYVSDLRRSLHYYSAHLGFPIVDEHPGRATLAINPRQMITLVGGWIPSSGPRLQCVLLRTDTLDATRAVLLQRGLKPEPVGIGFEGVPSFQLTDPNGRCLRVVDRAYRFPARPGPTSRVADRLNHTGIDVARRQLDASLRFYRDGMGFTETWRYPSVAADAGAAGPVRLIKLRVPGSQGDVIELMVYDQVPDRWAMGAWHHLAFAVTDIQPAYRFLVSHPVPGADAPKPAENAEHLWAIDLFDPDGIRTEIQALPP